MEGNSTRMEKRMPFPVFIDYPQNDLHSAEKVIAGNENDQVKFM